MKRASKAGRFQDAKGVIGSDLGLAVNYLAEGVRERLRHIRPKDILAGVIRNFEREPTMTSNSKSVRLFVEILGSGSSASAQWRRDHCEVLRVQRLVRYCFAASSKPWHHQLLTERLLGYNSSLSRTSSILLLPLFPFNTHFTNSKPQARKRMNCISMV